MVRLGEYLRIGTTVFVGLELSGCGPSAPVHSYFGKGVVSALTALPPIETQRAIVAQGAFETSVAPLPTLTPKPTYDFSQKIYNPEDVLAAAQARPFLVSETITKGSASPVTRENILFLTNRDGSVFLDATNLAYWRAFYRTGEIHMMFSKNAEEVLENNGSGYVVGFTDATSAHYGLFRILAREELKFLGLPEGNTQDLDAGAWLEANLAMGNSYQKYLEGAIKRGLEVLYGENDYYSNLDSVAAGPIFSLTSQVSK